MFSFLLIVTYVSNKRMTRVRLKSTRRKAERKSFKWLAMLQIRLFDFISTSKILLISNWYNEDLAWLYSKLVSKMTLAAKGSSSLF